MIETAPAVIESGGRQHKPIKGLRKRCRISTEPHDFTKQKPCRLRLIGKSVQGNPDILAKNVPYDRLPVSIRPARVQHGEAGGVGQAVVYCELSKRTPRSLRKVPTKCVIQKEQTILCKTRDTGGRQRLSCGPPQKNRVGCRDSIFSRGSNRMIQYRVPVERDVDLNTRMEPAFDSATNHSGGV